MFAGWPGRSADGAVLKHSPLSKELHQLMDSDATYITDTYHIVGDKAFPLKKHILTPYKKYQKRRQTRAQKIYNKHLASKRQVCRHHGVLTLPDTDTYTRGLLDLVNCSCFVARTFQCFHCNAMRNSIKTCMKLHAIQQIQQSPVQNISSRIVWKC